MQLRGENPFLQSTIRLKKQNKTKNINPVMQVSAYLPITQYRIPSHRLIDLPDIAVNSLPILLS